MLDSCAKCKKSIRSCPAQAIRQDPEPDADGRISMVDSDKCGPYMSANHGCGVCSALCPFSLAGYEKNQDGFLKAQARRLEQSEP
jgi:epoxyqueuosine reductase QueG